MARDGAAIMRGVPAFGLPKISNRVGFIFNVARSASSLKFMVAKIVSPRVKTLDFSRSNVFVKECLLSTYTIPFLMIDNLSPIFDLRCEVIIVFLRVRFLPLLKSIF
jgi:hypothetical protein